MSRATPSRTADPTTCLHPRGYDAAGACFNCDAKIGESITEYSKRVHDATMTPTKDVAVEA